MNGCSDWQYLLAQVLCLVLDSVTMLIYRSLNTNIYNFFS